MADGAGSRVGLQLLSVDLQAFPLRSGAGMLLTRIISPPHVGSDFRQDFRVISPLVQTCPSGTLARDGSNIDRYLLTQSLLYEVHAAVSTFWQRAIEHEIRAKLS